MRRRQWSLVFDALANPDLHLIREAFLPVTALATSLPTFAWVEVLYKVPVSLVEMAYGLWCGNRVSMAVVSSSLAPVCLSTTIVTIKNTFLFNFQCHTQRAFAHMNGRVAVMAIRHLFDLATPAARPVVLDNDFVVRDILVNALSRDTLFYTQVDALVEHSPAGRLVLDVVPPYFAGLAEHTDAAHRLLRAVIDLGLSPGRVNMMAWCYVMAGLAEAPCIRVCGPKELAALRTAVIDTLQFFNYYRRDRCYAAVLAAVFRHTSAELVTFADVADFVAHLPRHVVMDVIEADDGGEAGGSGPAQAWMAAVGGVAWIEQGLTEAIGSLAESGGSSSGEVDDGGHHDGRSVSGGVSRARGSAFLTALAGGQHQAWIPCLSSLDAYLGGVYQYVGGC